MKQEDNINRLIIKHKIRLYCSEGRRVYLMAKGYNVAIVGATGAVGQEILKVLEERSFPVADLKVLASSRSEGKKIKFIDEELTVHMAKPGEFQDVDIVLFAGGL